MNNHEAIYEGGRQRMITTMVLFIISVFLDIREVVNGS